MFSVLNIWRHDIVNCSQKSFSEVLFCLITCIPGLWDSMNWRLCCVINTFCVLCLLYDPLTSAQPLPTFSVLPDAWNEDSLCPTGCTALPLQSHAQPVMVLPILLPFFILKALSKGKGQWNAWPQCNTLLWGVGCSVKWHLGQHCAMPRKEQKLFSLANLRS